MSALVVSFVVVTSIGFLASLVLVRQAIGDWLYERAQTPLEIDRRWVAMDLLITGLTGVVCSAFLFSAGALVELAREGMIARTNPLYQAWPWLILGAATQVTFLRLFKLYSRRHLHQLQSRMLLLEDGT